MRCAYAPKNYQHMKDRNCGACEVNGRVGQPSEAFHSSRDETIKVARENVHTGLGGQKLKKRGRMTWDMGPGECSKVTLFDFKG